MEQKEVPFIIEKNQNGTYAIIENPESEVYGIVGWIGEKVVRSPFFSEEEARQRELEIAEHWGYKVVERKPTY